MSNIPEYSVSEISTNIKHSLENQFNRVKIKGEISGLTRANSGHFYFNLKDEEANLASIIWRGKERKRRNRKKLPYIPNIIGIITSPTGAVIEDIKKRIKERFASNILLWPVAVQGNNAEQEIESAILGFNNYKKKTRCYYFSKVRRKLRRKIKF